MGTFTTDCNLDFDFGGHTVSASQVVLRTQFSVIFVNIKPFKTNHLLVCPIFSYKRFHEISPEECIDLSECVRLTLLALSDLYSGYTIGVQDGEHAGQTVYHVHIHIVPRNEESQDNSNFDSERKSRTEESMRKEANYLKPMFEAVFGMHYAKGEV